MAAGDKVYARWKQTGNQVGDANNFQASGLPVTEIGSSVYRVADGKIVEYWVQIDRKGTELQQAHNQTMQPAPQKTGLPFPDAYRLENTLYISGQIGLEAEGHLVTAGFETEARHVMDNLGRVLRQNNLNYGHLASVTIYLSDMENYATFNKIYSSYFDHKFPARFLLPKLSLSNCSNRCSSCSLTKRNCLNSSLRRMFSFREDSYNSL